MDQKVLIMILGAFLTVLVNAVVVAVAYGKSSAKTDANMKGIEDIKGSVRKLYKRTDNLKTHFYELNTAVALLNAVGNPTAKSAEVKEITTNIESSNGEDEDEDTST